MKSGGLLQIINQYDREQTAYIHKLETQLAEERERNVELTSLLINSTMLNERKQLQLILAGHFDEFKSSES